MLINNQNIMIKTALFLGFIFSSSLSNIAFANDTTLPIISGVGGNFTALNGKGEAVALTDYKGKVVVLAFGYTNCADICPFTLGYLKQLYNELSPEEQKETRIIFVTIDPKYDTPEHLNAFVTFFNKDFIGLSGTQEQIDKIVSLYQAEYHTLSDNAEIETKDIRRVTPRKTNDDKEKASLFSHSVTLYLIGKKGHTRSLEYTGTAKDEFITKIRSLINENTLANNKAEIITEQLRVILPPSVANSTSIYGIIKNTGNAPDTLINISSNAGMVMLHKTDIKQGMAQMNHVGEFVLDAGQSLLLKPMSYHLMIMNIDHQIIKKDAEITLFLEFKKAGKLKFKVPVVEK
ncbi:MAG TPA: copper chaperone PCu(A)C [Gammaproteobacteria bacterium]|nr:copper chaperone PCu(A)C [Gammaproteobacteria bacterium]